MKRINIRKQTIQLLHYKTDVRDIWLGLQAYKIISFDSHTAFRQVSKEPGISVFSYGNVFGSSCLNIVAVSMFYYIILNIHFSFQVCTVPVGN